MQKSGLMLKMFILLFSTLTIFSACEKDSKPEPEPSDNLALDSLVATKRNIVVWEKIYITAYARGQNLSFKWSANHGSLMAKDTSTVKYWCCPSCEGLNTIECIVSNEFGSISDTIMIQVTE